MIASDNRCPRCSTRAFLRVWGGFHCYACSFEPKSLYYPVYVNPGSVMSTPQLNILIDTWVRDWERQHRRCLERERQQAVDRLDKARVESEKRERDLVAFVAECERLAWSRIRLAKRYGITTIGISKKLERAGLNNPTARAENVPGIVAAGDELKRKQWLQSRTA